MDTLGCKGFAALAKNDFFKNINLNELCSPEEPDFKQVYEDREKTLLSLFNQCRFILRCIILAQLNTRTKKKLKIGVLGSGLLGNQLVDTLLDFGIDPENIAVTFRRNTVGLELKQKQVGIVKDPKYILDSFGARLIFLCCMPNQLLDLANIIKESCKPVTIICSLVANTRYKKLSGLLQTKSLVCVHFNPARAKLENIFGKVEGAARQFFQSYKNDGDDTPSSEQFALALSKQCTALGLDKKKALACSKNVVFGGKNCVQDFCQHFSNNLCMDDEI